MGTYAQWSMVKCFTSRETARHRSLWLSPGSLQVVQPSVPVEILVTVYEPGHFTGEVGILSGRPTLFRMRATKPGKVIELDRQQMLALIQTDAELGDILMRAFILRRVELIAAGVGDTILIGSIHSAVRFESKSF